MAWNYYDVKDIRTGQKVAEDILASKVCDITGIRPEYVSQYVQRGMIWNKRYKITLSQKRTDWKDDWDETTALVRIGLKKRGKKHGNV